MREAAYLAETGERKLIDAMWASWNTHRPNISMSDLFAGGKIRVLVKPEVLGSAERALAAIAHESMEMQLTVKALLSRNSTMATRAFAATVANSHKLADEYMEAMIRQTFGKR